jgi:hypothetical protein
MIFSTEAKAMARVRRWVGVGARKVESPSVNIAIAVFAVAALLPAA